LYETVIKTIDEADIYGDYSSKELTGKNLSLELWLRDRIEVVAKCGV